MANDTFLYFEEGRQGGPVGFFRGKVAVPVEAGPQPGETWLCVIEAERERKFDVRPVEPVSTTLSPFPVMLRFRNSIRWRFKGQRKWGLSSKPDRYEKAYFGKRSGHDVYASLARLVDFAPRGAVIERDPKPYDYYRVKGLSGLVLAELPEEAVEVWNARAERIQAEMAEEQAAAAEQQSTAEIVEAAANPPCPLCGERGLARGHGKHYDRLGSQPAPQEHYHCRSCGRTIALWSLKEGEFVMLNGGSNPYPGCKGLCRAEQTGIHWASGNFSQGFQWGFAEGFPDSMVRSGAYARAGSQRWQAQAEEAWRAQHGTDPEEARLRNETGRLRERLQELQSQVAERGDPFRQLHHVEPLLAKEVPEKATRVWLSGHARELQEWIAALECGLERSFQL